MKLRFTFILLILLLTRNLLAVEDLNVSKIENKVTEVINTYRRKTFQKRRMQDVETEGQKEELLVDQEISEDTDESSNSPNSDFSSEFDSDNSHSHRRRGRSHYGSHSRACDRSETETEEGFSGEDDHSGYSHGRDHHRRHGHSHRRNPSHNRRGHHGRGRRHHEWSETNTQISYTENTIVGGKLSLSQNDAASRIPITQAKKEIPIFRGLANRDHSSYSDSDSNSYSRTFISRNSYQAKTISSERSSEKHSYGSNNFKYSVSISDESNYNSSFDYTNSFI